MPGAMPEARKEAKMNPQGFPLRADNGNVATPEKAFGAHLYLVPDASPIPVNGKVTGARPPRRLPNKALRSREHLTPPEVDLLIEAAGRVGRHGHRDSTIIMIAYRHGFRVSELVALRWDMVDLKGGLL